MQVRGDHLLYRHEPLAIAERDQAREHRGNLEAGKAALASLGVAHHCGNAERQVRDIGERVRRVYGKRGQNREDTALKDLDCVTLIKLAEFVPRQDLNAFGAEQRP